MSDLKDDKMIRNWDYLAEYRASRREILAIVDRVFSSGRLILGQEVEDFEAAFARFCGVAHGVGVNSGTDALILALRALGIGAGDEVITVSFTAVPTVAAIRAAGARPVFVDVEEDTALMNVSSLPDRITARTRCIVPVHLFGQPVDMSALSALASGSGLRIVEDCAQAAGALFQGRTAGSFGDIGAFSFYPTKILGAYGDAGMIVTDGDELQRKLRRLRFYGIEREYHSEEEGFNSRLDELQAALLHHKLSGLEESVSRRVEIAGQYSEALRGVGDIQPPVSRPDRSHQFYVYTLRTGFRARMRDHLAAHGVEARVNYDTPVHLMRGYEFLGYRRGDLPVTERLASQVLSLPMHPLLSDEDVARVVSCVRTFFDKGCHTK